jgi:hypothetical protein
MVLHSGTICKNIKNMAIYDQLLHLAIVLQQTDFFRQPFAIKYSELNQRLESNRTLTNQSGTKLGYKIMECL